MTKPTLLLLSSTRPLVEERLAPHVDVLRAGKHPVDGHEDRVRAIAGAPTQMVDAATMDRFPNLELIANFGVGYDAIDAKAAAARGVIVTNTPDVLTEEVADLAIGLMIMTVRRLGEAERYLRAGKWESEGPFPLSRGTLRDKRVGILGLGRIGKAIARRIDAMGLPIAYCGRRRQEDVPYTHYTDSVELARHVDVLICVLPGGRETANIVNEHLLRALGPDGFLVNVGRGSAIDEEALATALESGGIAGAGLDVFRDEPHVPGRLMDAPNAVLLPHVGSASEHTRDAMAALMADNVVAWFTEGKVLTPVPETPPEAIRKTG